MFVDCTKIEWQIFRDTENTEKSRKIEYKQKTRKITENSIFTTQKQKISKKSLCLEYFKVKFIIKISDLLNCSENLTKTSYFICQCGIVGLSCVSLHFQTLHSSKKTLHKIPEHSKNYNHRKSWNLTFKKTENLPLYTKRSMLWLVGQRGASLLTDLRGLI